MTDQQPHTPTTEDIRNAITRDESDWREAGAHFDLWFAAEIVAAEQRGAERAFRKTQEIIADTFDHTIDEERNRDDMINTGYLIIELDAEIQDLLEGDDA